MTWFALDLLAETESSLHRQLPFESWVFGVIALVIFLFLGFVTLSYRDVANRHSHKFVEDDLLGHDGHGQEHLH